MKLHEYDEIINKVYVKSKKHPPMAQANRATQFAPFAALTGHKEVIQETGRLTEAKRSLDENQKMFINEILQDIQSQIQHKPTIKVTHFLYDENKEGGKYVITKKQIKRIDEVYHTLLFTDHTRIRISDVYDIEKLD